MGFVGVWRLLVLGAALAWAGGVRSEMLPEPGGDCRACYALVVDAEGRTGPGSPQALAEALETRGYEVVRLDRPRPHRLIYHTDRLFRRAGANREARLVFWYGGALEGTAEDGLALLLPGQRAPGAAGAPGLDLRALLALADESAAEAALLVLDAPLPEDAPLALAEAAAEGAPARLVVARGSGARAAALGPVFAELFAQPEATDLAALARGIGPLARVGYLTEAAAEAAEPAAQFSTLAFTAAAGGEVPVPDAVRLAGLEAPEPRPAGAGALCDRLAADPDDAETRNRGVPDARIDGARAVEACLAAALAAPETLRFGYQLGRAYRALGRPGEAALWFERVARLGSVPGQFAIGLALSAGEGVARDPRGGAALVERAAEALYPPAVRRLAETAFGAGGSPAARERALTLLRRTAPRPGQERTALLLAEILAKLPTRGLAEIREARENYAIADRARLPGARQGVLAMDRLLETGAQEAAIAACEGLLDFEIEAVEGAAGLPPGSSMKDWIGARKARERQVFGGIEMRRAAQTCAPLVARDDVPPALLAKMGYLGFRGEPLGGPSEIGGEPWANLIARAAVRGDASALYVRGYTRLAEVLNGLREGRKDGRRAAEAVRNFDAACRGRVAEACYMSAFLNIESVFTDLPGFRPDPRAAIASLERVQADLAIARTLLLEVLQGHPDLPHLRAFRDPRRANELRVP